MGFDLIQESKRVISISSVSAEGTRKVVEYLAPFCGRAGFHQTLQAGGNGDADEVNLIAHTVPVGAPDLCPEGLALVTHLDTVPAGDLALWTETGGHPFKATLNGDRIYGLGSADTKLDFLCKLKAVEGVGLKNLKIPLALIGTFGEERALAGTRLLRETGLIHPRFVLVSEPSNLHPVIAHKGILYLRAMFSPHQSRPSSGQPHPPPLVRQNWTISPNKRGSPPPGERPKRRQTFKGKAAHGSMPHLGENAIIKAAETLFASQGQNPFLQLLNITGGTVHNIVPESCTIETTPGESPCPRINFLRKFFQLIDTAEATLSTHKNEAFDPPQTTCNVGVIRTTGTEIEIEFDFRLIPETDGNALFEIFRTLPQEVPGARVEVIRSNAPMKTDPSSEIARRVGEALREVGLPVQFMVKSGNTEGAIFNEMGAESIVMGPGTSVGNIHAPNEHNLVPELHKAVEFYAAFLRQFC